MFDIYHINSTQNLFDSLSKIEFENIAKGRQGAIIVKPDNNRIPIVRTTTKYNKPVQFFTQEHLNLIEEIKNTTQLNLDFNNAMVEIYDSQYHKMGFHTDQSLDLENDSIICIFSCYELNTNPRSLIVQNKNTKQEFTISMKNNSLLLFSTKANSEHVHKIILDNKSVPDRWLGITFRKSKTFIKFIDERPYFLNNLPLVLANELETKEFLKFKGDENKEINFKYKEINYTISPSDIILAVNF